MASDGTAIEKKSEFALTPARKAPPSGLFPGFAPSSLFRLLKYLAFFIGANGISSILVSIARGFAGSRSVASSAPRPAKTLELYEWSGCPFCRNLREAISALDLPVLVYPTPRLTIKAYGVSSPISRFRPKVQELGGKQQFPFLVDPNTGRQLYESSEIANYLYSTYGPGKPAQSIIYTNKPLAFLLPSLLRAASFQGLETGVLRCPSNAPAQPIELWTSESNPFGRIVKEALTCLEIPYLWRPTPWGTRNGMPGGYLMGVWLRDPNGGFESGVWFRIVNCGYM